MSGIRVEKWPHDGDEQCPKCGKKMLADFDPLVVCTYPAIHHFWWKCGCGHVSEMMEVSEHHPTFMERWAAIQ